MADWLNSPGSAPPFRRRALGCRPPWMWLGTAAIALLMGPMAQAGATREPIPFGQPLPGSPAPQAPEATTATEAVTATFEPLDARPADSPGAVRVELRLPTPTPGDRPGATAATAADPSPQGQPLTDTAQMGGWLEEPIAPTTANGTNDPTAGGQAAIAALGAGPYGVYVFDDRLSTLNQVSRLSASATFATYGNRTAIQAGVFDRQGDAIARVRELAQLGLVAEVAPVPPMADRAIAMGGSNDNSNEDFVDPGLFFANFNPTPSEAVPLPASARQPPIADPSKALPLPAPPPLPTGGATAQADAAGFAPQEPSAFARLAPSPPAPAATPEAIPYAIRLVGNPSQFDQWRAGLRRAGIPEDNTTLLEDNGVPVLEVGPFQSFAIAARWRDYMRRETGQTVDIYANGWIVETDPAAP